jgi:recombination protein RecA
MTKKIAEDKVVKKASDGEKEILSLFGEDCLYLDGDIGTVGTYDIIRTGSASLDYALGVGGIPRGRIIQLAGKESSGKTLLSLLCIKNWLNENPGNTAMFVDAEFTYDASWAKSLGLDTSRIIVAKTNDAKKIFEGLLGKTTTNKATGKTSKSVKGVLDLVVEGTDPRFKNLGLIVIDSVAAMNTPMEADATIGKQNMAPMPRFLSTELKKLTPAIAEANVAVIFINQIRVNPGIMFGSPEDSPGGKALKHACSVMINMAAMGGADNRVEDDNEEVVGHKVKAKIQKNKVGAPYREAVYTIKYTKGIINRSEEVLDLAILVGLITKPNIKNYVFGEEKFVGRQAILDYLADEDKLSELEESCRERYLSGEIQIIVSNDDDEDESDSSESMFDVME